MDKGARYLIEKTKGFLKNLSGFRSIRHERDCLIVERDNLQRDKDRLVEEKDSLMKEWKTWVQPGHFYSPIPCIEDLKGREIQLFHDVPESIPGINLNEKEQLDLFDRFISFYKEQPFQEDKKDGLRYFFENPSYSYSDAIFLHCMIRYSQPKKFIEVGSGYSSCVTLDTNEIFFDNSIDCTFIDPYPQLLKSLVKPEDFHRINIISQNLQEIDVEMFQSLDEGDILFIDSTHVSKIDSDVNYIFFKLLPSLKSGVYIHFHDIFYPFEYPQDWVYEGRAWNEDYLLRAFLQYNASFEICFFNTFLEHFHERKFMTEMPLCLKNKGGSIWLRKK